MPTAAMDGSVLHEPVMMAEVLRYLEPARGGVFVDCTVGTGGHTRGLLEHGATHVIGLDRDREALAVAAAVLASWAQQVELVHSDFRDVGAVLDARGASTVDGALADLGMSSFQLETAGRGFSFRRDEPLDMRMDRSQGLDAAAWLRTVPEAELARILQDYGEERHARRIARSIVDARRRAPLTTTGQLAAAARRAIPGRGRQRIDPATRTFQAVRIWINRELEGLAAFVETLIGRLRKGGRLVVITFHSLEDRVVKHTLRALEQGRAVGVRVLTRRPARPHAEEIARNPRARSAKLRAAERLA